MINIGVEIIGKFKKHQKKSRVLEQFFEWINKYKKPNKSENGLCDRSAVAAGRSSGDPADFFLSPVQGQVQQ